MRLHLYSIDQGLLCYTTDVENIPLIVVPHDVMLKYRNLYEANDTAVSGHLVCEKTYSAVGQCCCWPKLYNG